MALIKCGECGRDISNRALACPSCGNPVQQPVRDSSMKVEIEKTSKHWKKRSLWGILLLFITFITMFRSLGWGFFFLFLTFCWAMYVGIGRWWTNG